MPKPLPQRRDTCSAKTPDGPCPAPSGHATGHLGYGCCRSHGGNSPTHVGAAFAAEVMEKLDRHHDRARYEGTNVPFGQPDPEADAIVRTTLADHVNRAPIPYSR